MICQCEIYQTCSECREEKERMLEHARKHDLIAGTELEVWQARLTADTKLNREQLMQDTFNQMTQEREEHLAGIKKAVAESLDSKYRAGQKEHGGNVWERNPLKEMAGEITDLIVYHACAIKRDNGIMVAVVKARTALQTGDTAKVQECLDWIFNAVNRF